MATTFAARVRAARTRAGLTQQQLADRAGFHVRTVENVETGRTADPALSVVLTLARALGVSAAKLIGPCAPVGGQGVADAAVRELWAAGTPAGAIAARLGMTRTAVGQAAARLGMPKRRRGRPPGCPQPPRSGRASPLAAARLRAGLSQPAVAAVVGCGQAAVSYWEAGAMRPRRRYRPALAAALGLTAAELDHILDSSEARP